MSKWKGTDKDTDAIFRDIFENEYEKMVGCAISYLALKNSGAQIKSKAEVAVQEMFALAWERRQEVLSCEKPIGWMYEAIGYKVKELLREENKWEKRLRRYKEFYIPPTGPHIELEFELGGIVPKEDLDLLYRIYVEGYSYQELCEEMNLTKAALADRVHRIKKKIRKALKE